MTHHPLNLLLGYWSSIHHQHRNDWTEQKLLQEARNLNPELEQWFIDSASKVGQPVGEFVQEMLDMVTKVMAEIKVEDDKGLGKQMRQLVQLLS